MTTISMNFKTEKTIKNKFDYVAKSLGISSSALLNLFVSRVAQEEAIPFKLEVVNKNKIDDRTRKEMIKVLAIENGLIEDDNTEINDLDQYFKDLGYE
jgi:DNA-damage-inducible protein J